MQRTFEIYKASNSITHCKNTTIDLKHSSSSLWLVILKAIKNIFFLGYLRIMCILWKVIKVHSRNSKKHQRTFDLLAQRSAAHYISSMSLFLILGYSKSISSITQQVNKMLSFTNYFLLIKIQRFYNRGIRLIPTASFVCVQYCSYRILQK